MKYVSTVLIFFAETKQCDLQYDTTKPDADVNQTNLMILMMPVIPPPMLHVIELPMPATYRFMNAERLTRRGDAGTSGGN